MSSKKNGGLVDQVYNFPQKKPKQSFGQMLHNSKDGTYFGRTPQSWGQLLLFYAIFYIVLAGMFTIMMQGLFSTLNDSEPKWQLDRSLIGTNPGMGYRPLTNQTERGSLIEFDTKKSGEGQYWVELMDSFLEDYKDKKGKHCEFNKTHNPSEVCFVDIDQLGPCTKNNSYGYANGRPCVILKLNKIFNWQPEYYDNPADLPVDMPDELKKHIAGVPQHERQQIWISCNGHRAMDEEKMGPVKFYPSQGFPAYYYPFTNQKNPDYMSPLVAVQFQNITAHEPISVECRAWARNIHYSGSLRDRMGSVNFQLMVD